MIEKPNNKEEKSADILVHLGAHEKAFSFQKDLIRDLGTEYGVTNETVDALISDLSKTLYRKVVRSNAVLDADAFDEVFVKTVAECLIENANMVTKETKSNPNTLAFFKTLAELKTKHNNS